MLPFHGRAPPAAPATKIRKKKKKNAKDDDINDDGDNNDDESCCYRHNNETGGGGPIQQAALLDLRELRQDFLLFLNDSNNIGNDIDESSCARHYTNQHQHQQRATRPAVGVAFGIFREVFRNAKVAALHPSSAANNNNRCGGGGGGVVGDLNAHAQLLYAACFQLLHEPFQQQPPPNDNHQQHTSDGDDANGNLPSSLLLMEQQAIYAIFSLYALYETNPLPLAPSIASSSSATTTTRQEVVGDVGSSSKSDDILSTLPCGLRDRENPKLVYRRAYRQGIRIDRRGYARLLQVQELARARIASCQQQHKQQAQQDDSASFSSSRTTRRKSSLHCCCGAEAAAADVLLVLERLWSKLVLSEYTGPRGLEALTGHEDYPFKPTLGMTNTSFDLAKRKACATTTTRTTTNNDTAKLVEEIMSGSSQAASVGDDDDDKDVRSGSVTAPMFSASLQSQLRTYLSARRAIRLPFNNSTATTAVTKTSRLVQERIRKALQPMFADQRQGMQQQQLTDPFLQIVNAGALAMTMQHPAISAGGGTSFATTFVCDDDSDKHGNDENVDNDYDNFSKKPRALEAGHVDEKKDTPIRNSGDTDNIDSISIRQQKDAESYDLVLPNNLPANLFESIHAAVRTLVNRDKDSFFTIRQPQTAAAGVATPGVEDDETAATVDDDDHDGTGVGVGHDALAALIAQAAALSAGRTTNTGATFLDSTSGEQKDRGRCISRSRRRVKQARNSDDSDDDLSNTSSTVGQRALVDLLSFTMGMRKSVAMKEQSKQPAKPRKRARKGAAASEPRKIPRKSIDVGSGQEDNVIDEDSADDSEEDEEEESVGGEGNAALELLLGRAMM